MDARVQWQLSDDVTGLVDAINQCAAQLLTAALQKLGKRVERVSCDAYTSPKVVELLKLSDGWRDVEPLANDVNLRTGDVIRRSSIRRGIIDNAFYVHTDDIMTDHTVRIIVWSTPGRMQDREQIWYGSVELINP